MSVNWNEIRRMVAPISVAYHPSEFMPMQPNTFCTPPWMMALAAMTTGAPASYYSRYPIGRACSVTSLSVSCTTAAASCVANYALWRLNRDTMVNTYVGTLGTQAAGSFSSTGVKTLTLATPIVCAAGDELVIGMGTSGATAGFIGSSSVDPIFASRPTLAALFASATVLNGWASSAALVTVPLTDALALTGSKPRIALSCVA